MEEYRAKQRQLNGISPAPSPVASSPAAPSPAVAAKAVEAVDEAAVEKPLDDAGSPADEGAGQEAGAAQQGVVSEPPVTPRIALTRTDSTSSATGGSQSVANAAIAAIMALVQEEEARALASPAYREEEEEEEEGGGVATRGRRPVATPALAMPTPAMPVWGAGRRSGGPCRWRWGSASW